jgi:branched-chain amino acid aminotransferase
MKIYINGIYYSKENAKVSVFDHGLLYGDGVFEGIRAYNGRVFKLYEHIERLFESAKSIMLDIPMDKEAVCRAVVETCRENKIKDGYIRLVVTRGEGALGLNPFTCKEPQVIIIADKIALYPKKFYKDGLDVVTVPTPRNASEAINPRIKSLNYLNNILAKIEAINAGVAEAIMFNSFGFVAECTGDNIFIIKKDIVYTPSLYMGVLRGITRDTVMELAENLGHAVKQIVMNRHDIYNADECFLTGTAAEVIPVVKADGRIIGNGKPGEITLKLINAFTQLTLSEGTDIYRPFKTIKEKEQKKVKAGEAPPKVGSKNFGVTE